MIVSRINHLNTLFIIATCIAAHYYPYHLLVASYAFLGPAHYLTQISWLHDRKYFAQNPANAPLVFTLITVTLLLLSPFSPELYVIALIASLAMLLPLSAGRRAGLAVMSVALLAMLAGFGPVRMFIALMLPTVLHVFVFTAAFMLAGAIRSRSASAYLSLLALLVGALSFLFWPVETPFPEQQAGILAGLTFFTQVAAYMQTIFHAGSQPIASAFGFLSFAYTYHYLNWFSKAEIIRWHHIPRARLAVIAALYLIAITLYLQDYKTGFMILLFLSILHVMLEFPLNLRTFGFLGRHAYRVLLRKPPAS